MSSHIDQKFSQAVSLHQAGQAARAAAVYREILAVAPAHFGALHLLGVASTQAGDPTGGLIFLDRAVALNPDDATVHFNRCVTLAMLKRYAEAVASADAALALKPDYAAAIFQRGNALRGLGDHAEALASFERTLMLDPAHVEARVNRAIELKDVGRYDEAVAETERAVAQAPHLALTQHNRAAVLATVGRTREALAAFDRAITIQPGLAEARFGAGECHLALGDFATGWALYEWRWKMTGIVEPSRVPDPDPWLGEGSPAGKTILLHAEQGLGDTIQFSRYAPLLRDRGARVVLEVQAKLKGLMATLDPAVTVVARGDELPPFDLHCPLMSLPGAFKTELATIPAQIPYLKAEPARVARWRARVSAQPGLNVGLAWSGWANHQNDRNRSAALSALLPLAATGARFFGLQGEFSPGDRATGASFSNFTHLGDQLTDFADIAALASALDVVVTVDTVFAHLAGALGKPVFVLLSKACDWRWLQGRADSPWYPTAKLFRQDTLGDWTAPIARLQGELGRLSPGG